MIDDKEILNVHINGKIEIKNKIPLKDRKSLTLAYTPGVAKVSELIAENKKMVKQYTIKNNSVAIVTDGTAVLGLGDIGPYAAMPVMEGKAMLFKEFADIDAYPICLNTKDTEEIIRTVINISPGFGGINLEDISAPRCFEIEERLIKELDIPVFHDDQHGTAVVVTAGLINALKLVGKKFKDVKIVLLGAGAAGTAIIKILKSRGVENLICCDRNGSIYDGRKDNMNNMKIWIAKNTNSEKIHGNLHNAMKGADIFIGVSGPNLIQEADLKVMNNDSIVFTLANPIPEIARDIAKKYAKIVATGRSDYPNQINNVLCFPGIFKAALLNNLSKITEEMKSITAEAIASVIDEKELNEDYIIPDVFNPLVIKSIVDRITKSIKLN